MEETQELADRLAELALRIHRRSRQESLVHGLTDGRLAALSSIVGEGRISLTRLAQAEGVSPATMARIVDWLEQGRLVIRRRDARDRRVVAILPTMLGRSLAHGSQRRGSSWLEALIAGLSDRDRVTVAKAVLILESATEH